MTEESNKDNEHPRISVESVKIALRDILGGLANQSKALCRTDEVPGCRFKAFDFKTFVGDIEKIYIPETEIKRSIEILKENSSTTEKCDMARNIEAGDVCIRNYQARNTLEEMNMKSNSNTIFEKPCKFSDSNICYSDEKSEQAPDVESEPLHQSLRNVDESRKISRTISFDDEYESSSTGSEEDCFSYACNSALTDKNSNSLKISREDSLESSNGMFIEKSSRTLKDTQRFLNRDFMISDPGKWSRLLYYRQLYGEEYDSCLTPDEKNFLKVFSNSSESPETLSPHCLLGSNRVSEDSLRIKENQEILNKESPISHLDALSNSPLYRHFSEKNTISFKPSDEDMKHQRLNFTYPQSIRTLSESHLVPIRVLKPSEMGQSIFKFSDSSKVSKPYKKSPGKLVKSIQNILNMDKMEDIINPDYVNKFSNLQHSMDNHQGSSVFSEAKEENEISKITENKCGPNASIYSEDRNTATQKDLSARSLLLSKDTTRSSNSSKNYSCNLLFSDNDTDTSDSDLVFSDSDYEPNRNMRLDPREPQNMFNTTYDFPDLSMDTNEIKEFSLDYITSSSFCPQGIENSDICDRLDAFLGSETAKRIEKTFSESNTRITRSVSNFSDRNKRTFEYDLKLPNTDQDIPKKSKISSDEELLQSLMKLGEGMRKKSNILNRKAGLEDGKRSPINNEDVKYSNPDTPDDSDTLEDYDTLEDLDTDSLDEDLDDIFKTVIKCNPIEKFEIPPYASTNAERISGLLKNPFVKYTPNSTQLDNIEEHQNVLKCFTDMDITSTKNFEVTDRLSQNCSLICDNLRKEYLDISAKVNWLLIKQTRGISSEEYQLRMRNLRSLDDELGYVSAKLMTTINGWEKQLQEIAQSIIRSQGLYQMGLLKICRQWASILLKFILEKQLKLEDYEKSLVFNCKQEQ